jgi:hypothetical protein
MKEFKPTHTGVPLLRDGEGSRTIQSTCMEGTTWNGKTKKLRITLPVSLVRQTDTQSID